MRELLGRGTHPKDMHFVFTEWAQTWDGCAGMPTLPTANHNKLYVLVQGYGLDAKCHMVENL